MDAATEPDPQQLRVLLRTATTRDATMAVDVLQRAGFDCVCCADMQQMVREIDVGAGVLLVAEEVMLPASAAMLAQALSQQPAWSDLPVLMLARQGASSAAINAAMDTLDNLTVLERPIRVASLISTLRSAMRGRKRQYELRGILEGLEQADLRKTEFLATLAHELRNPMAPVSNVLAILTREAPPREVASRYYAMMTRQLDHMVRLVNDLMEISRITRGKIELRLEEVALESVVRDAIELSQPMLDAQRHHFELRMGVEPLVVQGDRVRLAQVFANLLNNAAKYTPAGGSISIALARAGDKAVVSVDDSGAGIPYDMLPSIFNMFVQVHGTAKAAQGGLGIGLTLVKNLVELHGGSVAASSAGLGQGSRFVVELPLLEVVRPVASPDDAMAAAPFSGLGPILVVDDNRDAADSLRMLIELLGGAVSVAYDGPRALQMAAEMRPALAILDIGMPGMDGCELAQRLRGDPAHKGLVLVALTGWGQENDRRRIADAGFDRHLLKPVNLEQLLAAVRTLPERSAVS